MKKILLSSSFALIAILGSAQREADAMYFGGCIGDPPCWCPPPYQGNIYLFNDDSLHQIVDPACFPLSTYFSKATLSDRHTGELLFASNGWRLINGQGEILSYKLWLDEVPHPGDSSDTTNVNITAGPLFLNYPGDSTKAYLFYGQLKPYSIQNYNFRADAFFTYALLDIPSRSLISQNNILLSDTSSMGDMQACRHANGRDWWIVKPHVYTDLYYVGLLDPQGIEMNLVQLPGVPHLLRTNTSSKFNIQGTKYIQYTGQPNRFVHEYDFDRCSGELSNLIEHDISDSIANNDLIAGMSISPDGSKFYFKRSSSNSNGITQGFYQIDLVNDEVNLISRNVSTPQMMPNGKKMIFGEYFFDEDNVIQRRVSEIANPNAPFAELEIEQFKYNTPNALLTVAPSNFAYFRLGADSGSACDTLGSVTVGEHLKAQEEYLSIFPNPSRDVLNVRLQQSERQPAQLFIYNAVGQRVHSQTITEEYTNLQATALGLFAGVYTLHVQSGKQRFVKKWVLCD